VPGTRARLAVGIGMEILRSMNASGVQVRNGVNTERVHMLSRSDASAKRLEFVGE